eukprot:7589377-Pyramimonas_sp.AAC.1
MCIRDSSTRYPIQSTLPDKGSSPRYRSWMCWWGYFFGSRPRAGTRAASGRSCYEQKPVDSAQQD